MGQGVPALVGGTILPVPLCELQINICHVKMLGPRGYLTALACYGLAPQLWADWRRRMVVPPSGSSQMECGNDHTRHWPDNGLLHSLNLGPSLPPGHTLGHV